MIRSLSINGFRGFDRLDVDGLGEVNLLVGRNDSGKTSMLEAILLLASRGDPEALWRTMHRRGEKLAEDRDRGFPRAEIEICHLFTGHRLEPGTTFTVGAATDRGSERIKYTIQEVVQQASLFEEDDAEAGGNLALEIEGGTSGEPLRLELTARGGVVFDLMRRRMLREKRPDNGGLLDIVGTESLGPDVLGSLWPNIALTREEDRLVRALQTIEPDIEKIAFVGTDRFDRAPVRGGFVVKCAGSDQPFPIGSMGDGIWRMLAIAITAIRSRGGVLLIDEVDTGLHHTVLEDMWRLVRAVSRDLGVQVFATTHSHDCVHSLATICRKDAASPDAVTVQRIEPQQGRTVPFSETEIIEIADRDIEIR